MSTEHLLCPRDLEVSRHTGSSSPWSSHHSNEDSEFKKELVHIITDYNMYYDGFQLRGPLIKDKGEPQI
jgi:hypothetical protein